MDELTRHYDVTPRDLARGRNLTIAAIASPLVLMGVPGIATLILTLLFGANPPMAVTILFFGVVITIIGLIVGLGLTGLFLYRRNAWTREMREKIAIDGIRASEVDWFRKEMRPGERRVLDAARRRDALLADNYADSLAGRLTATRIIRSSKRELQLMQRRKSKVKMLKTDSSLKFQAEIDQDITKISSIRDEAKVMLAEAETRLQMLEAAATRGTTLEDSEIALKKLAARSTELPMALEQAKLKEEIRRELEEDEKGE